MAKKFLNERGYERHLTCSESTFELVMNDCIKEYLDHHPEMKNIRITSNKILYEIAHHYLRTP